eukprot:4561174-Karenia_brevis.AAC.1
MTQDLESKLRKAQRRMLRSMCKKSKSELRKRALTARAAAAAGQLTHLLPSRIVKLKSHGQIGANGRQQKSSST